MSGTEPEYWAFGEEDHFSATEPEEAIGHYLEACDPLPETIEIHGYSKVIATTEGCHPLEHLLECMDEEYGDPDGGAPDETDAMRAAEKAFLAVVEAEYMPWACDRVSSETINVKEWVEKHGKDWRL